MNNPQNPYNPPEPYVPPKPNNTNTPNAQPYGAPHPYPRPAVPPPPGVIANSYGPQNSTINRPGNPVPFQSTNARPVQPIPPQPYSGYSPAPSPPNFSQPTQPIRPPSYPPQPPYSPQRPPVNNGPVSTYQNFPVVTPTPKKSKENFEVKYGSKITIIIGVFMLLLAVVFGLYYTFTLLDSDIIKPIIAYVIGLALIAVGEFSNRKKFNTFFSTGLSAGGIGVFFATTLISTTYLEIFAPSISLIIFVAIFILSLLLSLRLDSQLVFIFAVIGGAIPLFSINDNMLSIFVSLLYIVLINILVIAVSAAKNWKIVRFFSVTLCFIFAYQILKNLTSANEVFFSIYAVLVFIAYFLLTTINALKKTKKLSTPDIVFLSLLSLGTSFFLTPYLSYKFTYQFSSFLSFGFLMAVHFIFYFIWSLKLTNDKGGTIYHLSAFSIFLLAFLIDGLSNAYILPCLTVVGLLFLMINLKLNQTYLKILGGIFIVISLPFFLVMSDYPVLENILIFKNPDVELIPLIMHGVITLMIFALLALHHKLKKEPDTTTKEQSSIFYNIFESGTILNTWAFIIAIFAFFTAMLPSTISTFWYMFGLTLASFIVPIIATRIISPLSAWVKAANGLIIGIGLIYLLVEINFNRIVRYFPANPTLMVTTIIAVLFVNIIAIFAIYIGLDGMITNARAKNDAIPIVVAVSTLILLYTLCYNYIPSVSGIILSAIVLICALIMVVFGFVKYNKIMRLSGLAISMAAVFKILVIDIGVKGWQRVVGFGVAGLVFIIMSFTYQYFSNRLNVNGKELETSNNNLNPVFNNTYGAPVSSPPLVNANGTSTMVQTINSSSNHVSTTTIVAPEQGVSADLLRDENLTATVKTSEADLAVTTNSGDTRADNLSNSIEDDRAIESHKKEVELLDSDESMHVSDDSFDDDLEFDQHNITES